MDIPHDHLICQRCGRLKDISLHGVREAIRETVGEDIISYELNAYYLCDDCKKEQEKQEVQNERIKGTKTEANLWTAFAGESQARNKYTYLQA